jgi:hypothetical protein
MNKTLTSALAVIRNLLSPSLYDKLVLGILLEEAARLEPDVVVATDTPPEVTERRDLDHLASEFEGPNSVPNLARPRPAVNKILDAEFSILPEGPQAEWDTGGGQAVAESCRLWLTERLAKTGIPGAKAQQIGWAVEKLVNQQTQ